MNTEKYNTIERYDKHWELKKEYGFNFLDVSLNQITDKVLVLTLSDCFRNRYLVIDSDYSKHTDEYLLKELSQVVYMKEDTPEYSFNHEQGYLEDIKNALKIIYRFKNTKSSRKH